MANYAKSSPWYDTEELNGMLEPIKPRPIPATVDDIPYQIDAVYNFRPDLLSNDIYENPKLWWVFSMRNPNELPDPIFDFVAGNIIMVPTLSTVKKALGL